MILIFSAMETSSQTKSIERQPVAAGNFYSASGEKLNEDLSELFSTCKKTISDKRVRAIISPHAGYVFSGKIAASAFSTIPADAEYKNIFIIGSSHVMAFDGASVYYTGDYRTPLGKAVVNLEIANKLRNENKVFNFPVTAHQQEHSIEVQIPFIQYHFKKVPPIIPIIIGTNNENTIRKIADALRPYFTPDNLFVISSDFSHYPPYQDAVETDHITSEAIISGKPEVFLTALQKNSMRRTKGLATSMCGWTSGLTLLYLAENDKNLEFNHVDYANSGDSQFGGKNEVVGYNAISLTEKVSGASRDEKSGEEFSFTEDEKERLFLIARNSIKEKLGMKTNPDEKPLPPRLNEHLGVFVTLKTNGNLRGCIGRFVSSEPLYQVVKESAISSAFEDPRFAPVSREEYNKLEFEITILGPLRKINEISEIKLGRHGIYIKKGMQAGTMLPQVATENGWTLEQFLGYTSRDKAGIGWDGWKNAELYIYDGLVLEEKK